MADAAGLALSILTLETKVNNMLNHLNNEVARLKSSNPGQYFDYIGGTSTGGLKAIMLGQLRTRVLAPQPPRRRSNVQGLRSYEVPAKLNGVPVVALPDTGAAINLVSENIARRYGMEIKASESHTIHLPGGCEAATSGYVVADFEFRGEAKCHRCKFFVLRNSMYDVVLSKKFLDRTETLTKFRYRITERTRPCVRQGSRLFLLDQSPKGVLRCQVNNIEASAYPDTGSELMFVSGEFCKRNGFHVYREEKYRRPIELIDGSIIWTDGMVLDAAMDFDIPPQSYQVDCNGYLDLITDIHSYIIPRHNMVPKKETFICDLHVINNLPVDIILSGEFIFQNNVFDKHQHLLCDVDIEPDPNSLFNMGLFSIRRKMTKALPQWWGRWRHVPQQIEDNAIPLADRSTWQHRWQAEEDRRNRNQRWIETLSEPQKSVEERNERVRQCRWDTANPRPLLTLPSRSFYPGLRRPANLNFCPP